MTLDNLFSKLKGGSGSGNFGHAGVPGHHGGSASSGGLGGGLPAQFESLEPHKSYEARPYGKKKAKPVETVEYRLDTENRQVLVKIDNKDGEKIEALEVGNYFKGGNDKDNFDVAITSHRNSRGIRNDFDYTQLSGSTKGTFVPGARSIEQAKRQSSSSASNRMKK